MRVIGLDTGERRIGVAISDALGITAQRLTVLERRALPADLDAIAGLVEAHQASAVVVGLPLTLKGRHSEQTTRVAAFIEGLRARLGECPVHTVDERLTTVQAQRALRETDTKTRNRKGLVDQMAAQLILQSYLDGLPRSG
jgi:putative Holliday junction resolvase